MGVDIAGVFFTVGPFGGVAAFKEIRRTSDRLCQEHCLSVIVPGQDRGKSYIEHQAAQNGTSYKAKLKAAIDRLIPAAADFEDLLRRLQKEGYEIKRGKYISCRAPGQERFTRLKTLGVDYTEEALAARIAGRSRPSRQPKQQNGKISLLIDMLQSLGMTFRKAEYMTDFAEKVAAGQFDLDAVAHMSDADAIREMSALKGIGIWTAEMILLFCLQRPDIFSYDDLAIQRGLRMVYYHRKVDRRLFEKYRRRFSPYCSVASLYLWAVAGGAIPEMRDYLPRPKTGGKGNAEHRRSV